MIFTTLWFPVLMVTLILVLRFIPSDKIKKLSLLTASFLVYFLLSGKLLLLLIFTIFFNYFSGIKIHNSVHPKRLLVLCVAVNLGLLSYFKYTNFFLGSVTGILGLPSFSLQIFLPVGISFYIFSSISYLVDIYRKNYIPEKDPADYALHIAFFPKIIAGPIVRPGQLLPQLKNLKISSENIKPGLSLFLFGLFKKVVIADRLASYFDPVFSQPELFSAYTLWLTAFGYSVQIYCDFSGYTDMALGTARLLGIRLPGNFNSPYGSYSVTEFWRRWHITLSSWLRDYLYIPLGGNRISPSRTYLNLLVTMLLGGLWHGASWTFVLWGGIHGLALAIERMLFRIIKLPGFLKWGLTYIFITLGWVIFRSPSLPVGSVFINKMLTLNMHGINWTFTEIIPVIILVPLLHLLSKLRTFNLEDFLKLPGYLFWNTLIFIMAAVVFLKPGTTSPFTYLQF